jgi:hypothetical protein
MTTSTETRNKPTTWGGGGRIQRNLETSKIIFLASFQDRWAETLVKITKAWFLPGPEIISVYKMTTVSCYS